MPQIKLIVKVIIIIIITTIMIVANTNLIYAQTSITRDVQVSASIGEYHFNLFGYSSPKALITFQGAGIYDQTYANAQGYFEFKNRFSPFSPHEACLTAQDQFGRLTSPVCLPPFPTHYQVTIGPVIIAPTISLDKENYSVNQEVILSGQTVPNTEVSLAIFTQEKNSPFISLIPSAYAFSFPPLKTKSDRKGNYAISLPSSTTQKYRLFTQTNYLQNPSPQSISLELTIQPWWQKIINFFIFLFGFFFHRPLEIIISLESLIIFLILHHHQKTRALVLRSQYKREIADTNSAGDLTTLAPSPARKWGTKDKGKFSL